MTGRTATRLPCDVEAWPSFDEDVAWDHADQELLRLGLGDGLPAVPPTRGRMERMLAATTAPTAVHGVVPPLRRELTLERVAYNCVLAGCEPAWLNVVFTAVLACLEPSFNLAGMQTTTGTAAVAVVLHGAAVTATDANAGANCLGPGNAANARIGRAVQLSLRNIGGAAPGAIDMATMGQPGKYTFCFAEDADSPLLPPLHARRGVAAEAGAVTVVGVSGTVEVVPRWTDSGPAVVETIARSMQILGGLDQRGARFGGGEQFVLLPPEIGDLLARDGWTVEALQQALFEEGRHPFERLPTVMRERLAETGGHDILPALGPQHIHLLAVGGVGIKTTCLPTWPGETLSITRALDEGAGFVADPT